MISQEIDEIQNKVIDPKEAGYVQCIEYQKSFASDLEKEGFISTMPVLVIQ